MRCWQTASSAGSYRTNAIRSYYVQKKKKGLYANIHAKRKRIKAGSKERMRKPGSKGAPTAKAFRDSAKTAKRNKPKKRSK